MTSSRRRVNLPVTTAPPGSPSKPGLSTVRRGAKGSGQPPIFGRQAQVLEINKLLEKVTGGAGGVLLFSGEHGVGKTRLLREAEDRAKRGGLTVLSAECTAQDREAPYAPWVEITRQCVSAAPRDQVYRASRPRMGALIQLVPELNDQVWLFDPAAEHGPQVRRALLESVARFFIALSESRPLLVSIDDLQSADSGSLELLETLTRAIQGSAVGIIGTYRDDPGREKPARAFSHLTSVGHSSVSHLILKPLDRASIDQMVCAVLGRASVPDVVLAKIFEKTKGNPYYAREVLRWLAEYERGSSSAARGASISSIQLPASLESAVETHLGWVPVAERPTPEPAKRVAVLPLTNISPDPRDEYFADGLTEELISVLSQIGGLRVIARTSVIQYKGATKPIGQIGSELGVGSVLEGSVRKAGTQLRITMQLIDVRTQEHRWAKTYNRKLENVFAIQADIAEQTAASLKVELLQAESANLHARPTSSLAAYESYLRGIQASRRLEANFHPDADYEAEQQFEKAIREDPRFSAAYAQLSAHLSFVAGDNRPMKQVLPRARQMLARALELNPNTIHAHSAKGLLAMNLDQDWEGAEAEFQQEIAQTPSDASAHENYGFLLSILQRFEEAKKQFRFAIELDPLWLRPRILLATAFDYSGDVSSAISYLLKLKETFGDGQEIDRRLAFFYADAGQPEEALKIVEAWAGTRDPFLRNTRAFVLARMGNLVEARAFITEWMGGQTASHVNLVRVALRSAAIGESEKALALLERDMREGDRLLWAYYQFPEFDSIREDPRFVALLRELKLPTTLGRHRSSSTPSPPT